MYNFPSGNRINSYTYQDLESLFPIYIGYQEQYYNTYNTDWPSCSELRAERWVCILHAKSPRMAPCAVPGVVSRRCRPPRPPYPGPILIPGQGPMESCILACGQGESFLGGMIWLAKGGPSLSLWQACVSCRPLHVLSIWVLPFRPLLSPNFDAQFEFLAAPGSRSGAVSCVYKSFSPDTFNDNIRA